MRQATLLHDLLQLAEAFVTRQEGAWEHADWELLLEKAASRGMPATDENKRALGNLLESCKAFYLEPSGHEASSPPVKPAKRPRGMAKA